MYHSEVLGEGREEIWKNIKMLKVSWMKKKNKATRNESQAALLLLADTLNCFHMGQSILEILHQQRQLSAAPLPWLQDRAGAGACAADWVKAAVGLCRAVQQQHSPGVGQRITRNERTHQDIHKVQRFTV